MAIEIRAVWALLREATEDELARRAELGALDIHARVTLRGGGVAVVADGFVDIAVDGTPRSLLLGSAGPIVIRPDDGPEWELARVAEDLLHPSEVAELFGQSGMSVPRWDVIAAPRRYELSEGLARWLAEATERS